MVYPKTHSHNHKIHLHVEQREVVRIRLTGEWGQGKARLSMASDDPVASRYMKVRVKEGCSEPGRQVLN